MKQKEIEMLNTLISRQLTRLERYGQLVEEQEALLDQQDYGRLLKVLDRKDRVLDRMDQWDSLSELAGAASGMSAGENAGTNELLTRLISRLDFFAGLEKECVNKALSVKEDIAGRIFALRRGKKLLRKYVRASSSSKARYKDLKG